MYYDPDRQLLGRYLKAKAIGAQDPVVAGSYALGRKDWGSDARVIKAAVSGLSTSDLEAVSSVRGSFQRMLWPMTVIGSLRGLSRVPFHTTLLTQVAGTSAHWVGSGQAIRMSVGTFTRDALVPAKVGAITVATREMLEDQSNLSEEELLTDLLSACRAAIDGAFLNPNYTTDDLSPPAINALLNPIVATAGTIAGLDAALQEACERLVAAGSDLSMASWAMAPQFATAMSLARGTAGAPAYPGMNQAAKMLCGLPVLTSGAVTYDSDGGPITLIDGGQISYAMDEPELSIAKDASLEMSDAPTGDSTVPTASSQTVVNLWDIEAVGFKVVQRVNWMARRPGLVQVILGAAL